MKNLIYKIVSRKKIGLLCFITCLTISSLPALAGTWSTENYLVGMDSVHIYLPSTSPVINEKRALMINLHGCSMSNTDMKNNAGWTSTADQFGMVVALPDVPAGGASFLGCWDYYGESHTRNNKYNDEIIDLANELMGRPELNIDPNQVYITGFSSGGGQANVIACLAPDIFAGVGSSAGPGLGTSSSQYSSVPWNYSDQDKASLCNNISGNYASNLSTQIYSTIHGSSDPTVAPEFNDHGANIMSLVYGASTQGQSTTIATGGTKTVYSDNVGPRVSKISVSGMGHDWSSENGGNSGYFINNKVDYPNYITQWFFDNNRRINDGDNLIDADGDGYSEISDCNDLDVSINPGTEDVCGDGIDQSCSGSDSICSSWVCREYTSYNTYHYNASPKRATYWYYNFQYHYYAKGSGEELAFTGPYSVTTVSEASLGYFEKGACL